VRHRPARPQCETGGIATDSPHKRPATGARSAVSSSLDVMLTDATGQVQGRSLTFHVGDERVLVDGREEVRTQMIIKQEPPKN